MKTKMNNASGGTTRTESWASFGCVLAALVAMSASATVYTAGQGETFELASDGAANAAGNLIDVSGSATLKLTGTAADGMFPMRLNVRFTSEAANAVLTVDASEVAGCTTLRMTGHLRDNSGTATIALPSTIGELVIGSSVKGSMYDLNFPVLEPDVSFAVRNKCDGTLRPTAAEGHLDFVPLTHEGNGEDEETDVCRRGRAYRRRCVDRGVCMRCRDETVGWAAPMDAPELPERS